MVGRIAFCLLLFLIELRYGSARHSVVKREAPDGQLYVFSSRQGCVSVSSLEPCTLSGPLSPYFAKLYEQNVENIKTVVKLYRDVYGEECSNAAENALCTQLTPHCFEDGSQDFGDAKATCEKTYDSCPSYISNLLKQQRFCARMKTGKLPKSDCVNLTRPIGGACPQPKYKNAYPILADFENKLFFFGEILRSVLFFEMPADFIAQYEWNSIELKDMFDHILNVTYNRTQDGERIFSDDCMRNLEDISCLPLYCSADEKNLLIAHDQKGCNEIVTKCFEEPLERLSITPEISNLMDTVRNGLKSSCKIHPKSSTAQLQPDRPVIAKHNVNSTGIPKPTSSATSYLLNSVLLSLSLCISIKYFF